MPTALHSLLAAARPFVTRSLRGPRARRFALLSVVLGAFTVLGALWLSFGHGELERDLRRAFDLELAVQEIEARDFVIVTDDAREAAGVRAVLERATLSDDTTSTWAESRAVHEVREAHRMALEAVRTPARTTEQRRLRDAAAAAVAASPWPGLATASSYPAEAAFAWSDATTEELRVRVDRGLVPGVRIYESPIDAMGAVGILGITAALVLSALVFVLAPLVAGMQLAQEAHDNTLLPLAGTALRPRELAFGLLAGPLAFVGILAAPQALLVLGAATMAGFVVPALGFLGISVGAAFALGALAQIVGLVSGRFRSPGMVAAGVLSVTAMFLFAGIAFGLDIDDDTLGVLAVLPPASATHLWLEAFRPGLRLDALEVAQADTALLLGTLGTWLCGVLAVFALARRVEGRSGPSLSRVEALVGAVVVTLLGQMAILGADRSWSSEMTAAGAAISMLPLAALLAARVPVGLRNGLDGLALRTYAVDVVALSAVQLGMGLLWLLADPGEMADFGRPVVLWHLVYGVAVGALMLAHAILRAGGFGAQLLMGLVACFAWVKLAAAAASLDGASEPGLLVMDELSAGLAVVEVALLVAVPWLLLRRIRSRAVSTRSAGAASVAA